MGRQRRLSVSVAMRADKNDGSVVYSCGSSAKVGGIHDRKTDA